MCVLNKYIRNKHFYIAMTFFVFTFLEKSNKIFRKSINNCIRKKLLGFIIFAAVKSKRPTLSFKNPYVTSFVDDYLCKFCKDLMI